MENFSGENRVKEFWRFLSKVEENQDFLWKIHAREAPQLATALNSVKEIYLHFCDLNDEDVTTLCSALKSNKSVTRVDLSGNNLSSKIVPVVMDLLVNNSIIEVLNLDRNYICSLLPQ